MIRKEKTKRGLSQRSLLKIKMRYLLQYLHYLATMDSKTCQVLVHSYFLWEILAPWFRGRILEGFCLVWEHLLWKSKVNKSIHPKLIKQIWLDLLMTFIGSVPKNIPEEFQVIILIRNPQNPQHPLRRKNKTLSRKQPQLRLVNSSKAQHNKIQRFWFNQWKNIQPSWHQLILPWAQKTLS